MIRPSAGLTIVEVLIAGVIFFLAVFPIFSLHQGLFKQTSQASHLLEAQCHLLEMVATIESRMYAQRFAIEEARGLRSVNEVQWGQKKIQVQETISQYKSSLTTGLWRIDCVLEWQESRGTKSVDRRMALSRLVAEPKEG
mgnify:FL=1